MWVLAAFLFEGSFGGRPIQASGHFRHVATFLGLSLEDLAKSSDANGVSGLGDPVLLRDRTLLRTEQTWCD